MIYLGEFESSIEILLISERRSSVGEEDLIEMEMEREAAPPSVKENQVLCRLVEVDYEEVSHLV